MIRRPRYVWTDQFHCGCIEDALRRSDLTGYCPIHGEVRIGRIRCPLVWLPDDARAAEMARLADGSVHSR